MGKNWAEDFSNSTVVCLSAGQWSVTKDGEGCKELCVNGESIYSLPSLYFYAELFESGIILYADSHKGKVFYAFKNNEKLPTLVLEGKNLIMNKEENLLVFYEETERGKEEKAILDSLSFQQLTQELDGQMGFNI